VSADDLRADDLRAGLIVRGLGGRRLRGFLPGQDNRAAIAEAVASCPAWIHGGTRGHVTRNGLGEWPARTPARTRAEAVVYLTWREVLEIVARGCREGMQAPYLAAWREYEAEARKIGVADADLAAVDLAAWELAAAGCVKTAAAGAVQRMLF